MQLSLHSDYACRVLIYLAVSKTKKSSVEEISDAFGISKNHLVKIVHELGKSGMIQTTRGRGGGICLAMSPEEISIGDVLRKTEPSFAIVECLSPGTNKCPITAACGLKPWLAKAMSAFLATLDDVTLADVVRKKRMLSELLLNS